MADISQAEHASPGPAAPYRCSLEDLPDAVICRVLAHAGAVQPAAHLAASSKRLWALVFGPGHLSNHLWQILFLLHLPPPVTALPLRPPGDAAQPMGPVDDIIHRHLTRRVAGGIEGGLRMAGQAKWGGRGDGERERGREGGGRGDGERERGKERRDDTTSVLESSGEGTDNRRMCEESGGEGVGGSASERDRRDSPAVHHSGLGVGGRSGRRGDAVEVAVPVVYDPSRDWKGEMRHWWEARRARRAHEAAIRRMRVESDVVAAQQRVAAASKSLRDAKSRVAAVRSALRSVQDAQQTRNSLHHGWMLRHEFRHLSRVARIVPVGSGALDSRLQAMEMEMRSAQVDAKGARAALDKAEERLRAARAALGALGALREDGAGALGGVGAGAVRKREEMLRKGQGG